MKIFKGILMLAAQFVGMAVAAYLLFNTVWFSRWVYNVGAWGIWPLLGALSAYMVTVRGVNNFLAWIAPPLAGLAAHYLAFFYMPESAGPFFICAFTAIVGAAAGDVVKKMRNK